MSLANQAHAEKATVIPVRERIFRLVAISEVGVFAALVLLVAFFFIIEPAFLSERNVRAMLRVVSFIGIIAVGQTLLLVAGEFDLSVGSVAGFSAVISAQLMTALALPVPVAIGAGILAGALLGAVNGVSVVKFKIPAFIQTLGMLFIGQGLIQVVTNGTPIYPLPKIVSTIGVSEVIFGMGWSFVFFISVSLVADFVLRRTVLGRNLYATGGNPEVAGLVGISAAKYKMGAFIAVGALAGFAGNFVMADLASGATSIGSGWELQVIAGVVVGGVSLFGGSGTIAGGVLGVLLLQVVTSGLVVIGVSSNWQQIAVGVIMVFAVGLDIARRHYLSSGGPKISTTEARAKAGPQTSSSDAPE